MKEVDAMKIYTLTIPGEPGAKARARVTKSGITYTPEKTKSYETFVQELFHYEYRSIMLEGPLHATIKAYFGLNKGDYGKNGPNKTGQAKLWGEILPTKRPDVDNIAKILLDSLNGIAYKDDSQICYLSVTKFYAEKPRVELTLAQSINARNVENQGGQQICLQ